MSYATWESIVELQHDFNDFHLDFKVLLEDRANVVGGT